MITKINKKHEYKKQIKKIDNKTTQIKIEGENIFFYLKLFNFNGN